MSNQSINDPVPDRPTGPLEVFDAAGQQFTRRPAWLLAIVLTALVMLPIAVWLDLRHISNESLKRQASELNTVISDIRSYYSRNVIGRVLDNDGKTKPAHNYEEIKGGIPIPATLSIELGQLIGKQADGIRYRFVSDETFAGRSPHNLDAFEIRALERLRAEGNSSGSVTDIDGSILRRQIRMAVPVVMSAACVSCHNAHPESPRKDWKVGDVRGIQSITIDQPIAANLLSFKYLLTYLLIAGMTGVAFAAFQWRQAVRFSSMNAELEEANSFLASISMKISKYLSPQVYKSIFDGKRDAIIATERKKLTIFFSDIEDFTTTTERLQPEELTELLNEYFTEMSKIAHEYGATVDKFIGDAILAFFGDPETLGSKEDALLCVEMAVAMQQRLAELNNEWRQRGIEKPFLTRMGINTGYCNVGNFGSEDRMDYTIIGAEANLAARLESIAKPGGIVISYETFALVNDYIKAQPLEPITLKGISRKVVPYAVEDIDFSAAGSKSEIVEASTSQLKLFVNPAAMDGPERKSAEKSLLTALNALRVKSSTGLGN